MAALLTDFAMHDALSLAGHIRSGDFTPLELLDEVADRAARVNPRINCLCHENWELAREGARRLNPEQLRGPFAGLPLFLKDLILWHEGTPITSGSRYLRDYRPTQTSAVVRHLLDAGMYYAARTLTAEFGALPTVESRFWGTTRNPWNPENSTGGSSGGAAALVASRLFPLADGNDGGGSVRGPAGLCGLVGLKPSRGRHSFAPFGDWRFGMGSCSCLSLSMRDTAAYLDVISGPVAGDCLLPVPDGGFLADIARRPARRRVAVLRHEPVFSVDSACLQAVEQAASLCRELGHELVDLELPQWRQWAETMGWHFQTTGAVWMAVRIAAQCAAMGREPTEEEMEPVTWAAYQAGQHVMAAAHERELESIRALSREIRATLEPYDAVLTPTVAAEAFPLGYLNPNREALATIMTTRIGLDWMRFGYYLTLLNGTGLPGLSLPLCWTAQGQPVGVQLVGRMGGESVLLQLGAELEEVAPWMHRLPPVCAAE